MAAWAGKPQRPCANMDNARSLDQSCVNHEFIKSKPLGTRGAGAFQDFCQDPKPFAPFFPGSYHTGAGRQFAIGFEGANVVRDVFTKDKGNTEAALADLTGG